ncbi:MAG: 4Fe-4S binding protein [Thermoguttaceae bacterium]
MTHGRTCLTFRERPSAAGEASRSVPQSEPAAPGVFFRRWGTALALLLLLGLVGPAFAAETQEMLSRPLIEGHDTPSSTFPQPRTDAREYLDVVVLLAALALASYFALRSRSRRLLLVLTVFSLVWFGFVRQGCVCAIGAIQNVALASADPSYGISLAILAFLALPIAFSLFFGRTFCAAVCPLGAVQELVALHPVKVPRWLDQTLGLVPFVYLGAAVLFAATGTAFLICEYDPFVAFFRLSGSVNMLIFGACFLIIGFYIGRPYCRYLCPLGAVFKLTSRVSRWRLRIPPDECINCRLCEDACPYGAIQPPTVEQSEKDRRAARFRTIVLLALAPLVVAAGAWAGGKMGVPMSRLHPEVLLAERVRLEETGRVEGTTEASDAFYNTGRPRDELYASARSLHGRFTNAGYWLGAWVGLVLVVKLVHTSIRRRRIEFTADRGNCVSCGRCFWYCPAEQVRLGLIDGVDQLIQIRRK